MATKQTSVEWLIQELVELDKQLDGRRNNVDSTILKINPIKIYQKAKQMHKDEVMDAYIDSYGNITEPEDYYNQKYGKEI